MTRPDLRRRLQRARLVSAASGRDLPEAGSTKRATLGRGLGPSGGCTRWRRCRIPFMPWLGLASARRRRRCVGGDRTSSLNESKSGHRAWPQRCDADLRGTAKGRARSSRNMYQARSPRSVSGSTFVARCVRSIFLRRIRGFDRSRETTDPVVSRFSDDLPLARGGAGPAWAHGGSEASIGEGHLARTGGIRHVCPQESSVVSAGRPRPSGQGFAQGRLEGLRLHCSPSPSADPDCLRFTGEVRYGSRLCENPVDATILSLNRRGK